jgi:hypothetical protein
MRKHKLLELSYGGKDGTESMLSLALAVGQ